MRFVHKHPTRLSHGHFIQYPPNTRTLSSSAIHAINRGERFFPQVLHRASAILKTARALHVADGVALDDVVGGFLLEDVDQLQVLRVRADAVDDGEREFALGQVLAEALVFGIFGAREVHVVVADLEEETD